MSEIVWREVTRNCHVGSLDDVNVVTVDRPQKNQPDGERPDWRIVVLGDRYTWNKTFLQYDPRDLDSTKSAAEARVRLAIGWLYRSLTGRTAAPERDPTSGLDCEDTSGGREP